MKFKMNLLVAAAALVSTGAHAAITKADVAPGSSSVLFVAYDAAHSTSLTIDLGVTMTDFLQASSFVGSTGALAYNGSNVSASWSFGSNSRSVNGSNVSGDYAWSTTFASFAATATSGYTWGVIAADNVSGAVSATNSVQNRSTLSTANAATTTASMTALTSSTAMSNAAANVTTYIVASNALGTNVTNADGANTASTGSSAYLDKVLKTNFAALPWSYMSTIGATQSVLLAVQAANPTVYQLGTTYGVDSLLSDPTSAATFNFDGTTLSYSVAAVPEPESYAMLVAGLAALAFVARRRKQA